MNTTNLHRLVLPLLWMTCSLGWAQERPTYRLAILGCHKQFQPAPALVKYLEAEPDHCLWIGDNVYADSEDDISYIEECYNALEAKPAFKEMRARFPIDATWDDHDFGLNNAGKEYPLKEQTKALFRKFWRLEETIPADRDGVYYAKMVEMPNGQLLQLIMLDGRYNRDLPQTDGDVLGENQWQWLERQLKQPADLRLLVSGFQLLLDERAGSETWAKFPSARQRLFELIRKTQAEGVFFLTGDQHYGEVNRMRGALDYDAIELQFAGINQIEKPEWNPLRVAPVITSKHSYALLDLYLEETEREVPHLLFHIYNAMTDQRELAYRVNLSELQLQVDFEGAKAFGQQVEVKIRHRYPQLSLHYTLDGQAPTVKSPEYLKPIALKKTTLVKAALFDQEGWQRSPVFETKFEKGETAKASAVKNPRPGLQFAYFEGNFQSAEALAGQSPKKAGIALTLDITEIAEQKDHFGLTFEGFVKVPEQGAYTFSTYSDDGSRLFINGKLVVDNDGSHSARLREGMAFLDKGLHPIKITYFEDYSGETLVVKMQDEKGNTRVLGDGDFFHQPK